MCQVLKPLGQLFHGEFGFSLNLQFGQFPQHLTATQSAQHWFPCLGETEGKNQGKTILFKYVAMSLLAPRCHVYAFIIKIWTPSEHNLLSQSQRPYHLPEESSHFAAILEDGPDEEWGPGKEAALLSIQAVSTQQLAGPLLWIKRDGVLDFCLLIPHIYILKTLIDD